MSRQSKSKLYAIEKMHEIAQLLAELGHIPKRYAVALVGELEKAFAQANFNFDVSAAGEYWSLDDADVCDAIRTTICRNYGIPDLTHDDMEKKYCKTEETTA